MANGSAFHLDLASTTLKLGMARAASDYRARAGSEAKRGGHVAGGVVGWDGDREALWDAAETAETPKRSRIAEIDRQKERSVARSVIIALPDALSPEEREKLVRGYSLWLRDRHGVAVQWDVHAPDQRGDDRNHHAHLMITTRQVQEGKFGPKTRELDLKDQSSKHLSDWREEWAKRTNRALDKAGRSDLHIEHRSHAAVAAEVGAIPLPPRPRQPVKEFQGGRKRHQGSPKPTPGLQPKQAQKQAWKGQEGDTHASLAHPTAWRQTANLEPQNLAYELAQKAARNAERLRQEAQAAASIAKAAQTELSRLQRLREKAVQMARTMAERGREVAIRKGWLPPGNLKKPERTIEIR